MKTLLTTAAAAALVASSAGAATFHNLAGSQNNNASYTVPDAGFSFTTGSLGSETNLASILLAGRSTSSGSTATDLVQFEVFADIDQDAATWDLGASLGLSNETQALSYSTVHTFTFTGVTLAENTSYIVKVHNRTDANTNVGWGLVNGATDAGTTTFSNGGAVFAGSHETALTVNTDAVPEPSSTALLGLGGLALLMRRRK